MVKLALYCSALLMKLYNYYKVALTLSSAETARTCTPKSHINLAFRFLLLKGLAMAWCQAHGAFIVHKTNIPL